MKTILLGLMVTAMMTTAGVYAASMTGSTKTIGGTGSVAVSAPATSASVAWTTDSSGNVTGANVTWTPSSSANYTLKVSAGSSTGSLAITTSGTTARTDAVTVSPAASPDTVSTAKVTISQD